MPASYFIQHFNFPEVLSGRISGEVAYSLDRDDPGTLTGNGSFEVKDGQFNADLLFSQLQGEMTALPPSLRFAYIRADVEFEKDLVRTPHLQLVSEGIKLEGSGRFVRDGDMDYYIKAAISPETASAIPVLRENFNIQGHRIAQQDIELAFNVSGPTFSPSGQLAELPPASVTLVSGALEVTSEAFRVIDVPRRILLDLLRIAGGIVGPPKSNG